MLNAWIDIARNLGRQDREGECQYLRGEIERLRESCKQVALDKDVIIERLRADMDQRMKAYVEYQERDEAEIERLRTLADTRDLMLGQLRAQFDDMVRQRDAALDADEVARLRADIAVKARFEDDCEKLRTALNDVRAEVEAAMMDRNAHLQRAERALAARDELLGLCVRTRQIYGIEIRDKFGLVDAAITKEMSDIGERLRQPLVHGLQHPNDKERAEAADEIERLRGHVAHRDKEIARLDALVVRLRAENDKLLAAHRAIAGLEGEPGFYAIIAQEIARNAITETESKT
jgi:hypothetical protein